MHQSLICYSFPGIVTFLLVLPYLVYAVPEPENKTEEVKRDSKSRWYTVKDLVRENQTWFRFNFLRAYKATEKNNVFWQFL